MCSSDLDWLEVVKGFATRHARVQQQQQAAAVNSEITVLSDKEQKKLEKAAMVPRACLKYLWGMQQEHPKVHFRIAALYLSGPLIRKSVDCRLYVCEENNEKNTTPIAAWVSNVANGNNIDWTKSKKVKTVVGYD